MYYEKVIPVRQLEVGDIIDTLIGYTLTVTEIETVKREFGSPQIVITAYSNMTDDKDDIFTKTYAIGDYVTVLYNNEYME